MRWTDEQIKAAEAVLCERIGELADGYYAEMIERMKQAADDLEETSPDLPYLRLARIK